MTTSSFVASTLHKKCNDIFLLTSHSFKSGEQFRKCFMIVLHNWNSEHSEQGSVSKTLFEDFMPLMTAHVLYSWRMALPRYAHVWNFFGLIFFIWRIYILLLIHVFSYDSEQSRTLADQRTGPLLNRFLVTIRDHVCLTRVLFVCRRRVAWWCAGTWRSTGWGRGTSVSSGATTSRALLVKWGNFPN